MSAATREFRSLDAARRDFMAAGRNEEIIEGVLGRLDCKTSNIFDALEYDGRPARTWPEAFAACCRGRSVGGERRTVATGPDGKPVAKVKRVSRVTGRSWATFDLASLRSLHPEFRALDLPAEVYEAQASAAERAWIDGMAELDGWADEEQAAWYEYGGYDAWLEEQAATWDEAVIAGILAMTGEQPVTEDMIEAETTRPLVCLDGGRVDGRASVAFAERMLAGAGETGPVDGGIFGIEIEAAPPQLPAWAWR